MTLISLNFRDHSSENLLVEARQIKFNMTDNPNFPAPDPGLDELGENIEEYSVALDNMGNGMGATLVKDDKREILESKLKDLGLYVEKVAKGNKTVAESSGFKLRDKPESIGVVAKGSNLKAVPGPARGSIKLSVDKIHGAKMYQFEYKLSSENSDANWTLVTNSQSSVIISNLVSGEEYTFRVVGLGTNPTRVYSDEVRSFVL